MSEPPAARGAERDGRSTRWDPHRKQRRQTIVSAAVEAIETFGPDALTGQIAQIAGVPRTHVYRHFDGKAALDRAVSRQVAGQLGERMRGALATRGSARHIIRGAVDEHLSWIEAHPNLYRFLAQHAWVVNAAGALDGGDAKAVFAVELNGLVGGYLRALGVDRGPDERLVAGIVGLVDATAAWWLERGTPSRAQVADELTERTWLLFEHAARELGLRLNPDQALPEP